MKKDKKIAVETLDIYAPLAHRLGLFLIKAELEDRCLKIVNAPYYHRITNLIENQRNMRSKSIEHMMEVIDVQLKNKFDT